MLYKLSIRNVKRSFRDYSIYFLTLTLGVSFFYTFNSIESQQILLDLSKTQQNIIEEGMIGLEVVSLFVSFILAFLILYANQFLVKRRKKELGIYKTLGMSKWNISNIFLMETLVVGMFSLISGLILGVLLSQGFSVLISSLFNAQILNYKFVFSIDATMKTMIFFSIIFIIVIIFNIVSISRLSLLDLIYGSKKNERVKLKNQETRFRVFVASIVMIIVSYSGLIHFGISNGLIYIFVFTSIIVVATFLLFFSLSSFVLSVISTKKDFYLKDLNMFLVRQVGSKINTNFIIMFLICIMLTGSITVLAGGFGYKKAMDEELKIVTPYDVTIFDYIWDDEIDDEAKKAKKFLDYKGVSLEDFKNYKSLFYYNSLINPLDMLSPYISETQHFQYANMHGNDRTYAISESDYKYLLKMQGIKPTEIDKNEVVLFTNMANFEGAIQSFINDNKSISINNKDYTFANDKVEFLSMQNNEIPRDILMVVLPDEDVKALDKEAELFVANYQENDTVMNDKLINISDNYLVGDTEDDINELEYDTNELEDDKLIIDELLPYTRTYVYEGSQGYTANLIFVGIYIGTIFLISSAAILTLQQLSEASDNLDRYTTLKSIGVDQKSIHKVIFNQIFIYFMVPLVVAIPHSVVALIVINNVAVQTATWSIIAPALIGASILIVIYGVYFYLTYKTYKSIVK